MRVFKFEVKVQGFTDTILRLGECLSYLNIT